MADFHQTGAVATLHRLVGYDYAEVERRLIQFSGTRKTTLILPSLFSELETPALANIVDCLSEVPYLDQIVIGLDRASEEQFRFAKDYFSRLPQNHVVIWNDGPRMRKVQDAIANAGLTSGEPGKGRNVWYCLGYVLAAQRADVIALHDCDIITYNRELLGRLIYPVVDPSFPYLFCKGYYPRIADGKLVLRPCDDGERVACVPLFYSKIFILLLCLFQCFLNLINFFFLFFFFCIFYIYFFSMGSTILRLLFIFFFSFYFRFLSLKC